MTAGDGVRRAARPHDHRRESVMRRLPFVATGTLVLALGLAPAASAQEPDPCLLIFGADNATIVGTNGDDVIRGTDGPDIILAGAGNDVIFGLGGDDKICGGDGNDRIDGGSGN